MKIEITSLSDILCLTPARFSDYRGFFCESWSKASLKTKGLDWPDFVQDNHSFSLDAGTVRGLHFQSPPHAQGKLVRCGRGRILDAVVDARKGSPTFGRWLTKELSFENGKQLWVPAGFLHGFMTLEPDSEIIYKCTDYYAPEHDGAIRWDSCGIEWPTQFGTPISSAKDAAAPMFADFNSPFNYKATA